MTAIEHVPSGFGNSPRHILAFHALDKLSSAIDEEDVASHAYDLCRYVASALRIDGRGLLCKEQEMRTKSQKSGRWVIPVKQSAKLSRTSPTHSCRSIWRHHPASGGVARVQPCQLTYPASGSSAATQKAVHHAGVGSSSVSAYQQDGCWG